MKLADKLRELEEFEDQLFLSVIVELLEVWPSCDDKTDADIERCIVLLILKTYPNCGILSEESYHDYSQTNYPTLFLIDPIDGSHNRSRGLPYYSICICKYQNKVASSSAVFIPHWNTVYLADSRKSFRVNLLGVADLRTSDYRCKSQRFISMFKKDLMKADLLEEKVRLISCSSIDLCLLAQGSLDVFVDRVGYEKECDVAAALHILDRAGGVFVYKSWNENIPIPSPDWLTPMRLVAASTEESLSEYI